MKTASSLKFLKQPELGKLSKLLVWCYLCFVFKIQLLNASFLSFLFGAICVCLQAPTLELKAFKAPCLLLFVFCFQAPTLELSS